MADIVNNLNLDVLKVPLGFIRVVEFPLVIIAFATACDFGYTGTVQFPAAGACSGATGTLSFSYPFQMNNVRIKPAGGVATCDTAAESAAIFSQSYQGQAQFFVFTGVISFLYILAILGLYLFKWPIYENDRRAAIIDLIVTAVLALFWFAGTCAWASAVTPIRGHTNNEITTLLNTNQTKIGALCVPAANTKCTLDGDPNFGKIIISAIAGFGCIVAFLGNVWFVYKETEWFKARQGPPPIGNLPGSTSGDYPPPAASGAGPYP